MNDSKLARSLLRDLNFAAFVRVAPKHYQLTGLAPLFYNHLFPPDDTAKPCQHPWEHSPMLDFFLEEAETFFEEKGEGKIDSGIWLETDSNGKDIPLEAVARHVDGTEVITIQCVREYYDERVRILQQARNELLEMDRLHSALATYKRKSLYDSLTNLYNRSAFEDFLEVQMANRRNMGRGHLSLLMIDIDFFKQVNDTHGHLVGDMVLTTLGVILQESLRRKDIPARFGGEEFVVLTPQTNLQQAVIVAEKLRLNMQNHDFGLDRPITISVGVATYQHGESSQRFIKRADDALYMAKQGGRNRVCSL